MLGEHCFQAVGFGCLLADGLEERGARVSVKDFDLFFDENLPQNRIAMPLGKEADVGGNYGQEWKIVDFDAIW